MSRIRNHEEHIILIIEDSDEDYYTICRAFKKAGIANGLFRCVDGEDALDYIYSNGKYKDTAKKSPVPNLILLDLNLPKKDGREVLEMLKADATIQNIPIIVMTTSDDQNDINRCYEFGANSYIQKPVDPDKFLEAIQRLKDYWFEIVILPSS